MEIVIMYDSDTNAGSVMHGIIRYRRKKVFIKQYNIC